MVRQIKVSAAVLNLRVHPHSRDTYLRFFIDLYRIRAVTQVYGDRYAILSSLDQSELQAGVVSGVITAFTRIESEGAWFDASTLQEASDNQVSRITIPAGLYPNASSFYFRFDLDNHRLYVETYSRGRSLTPNSILGFFKRLSQNLQITTVYGTATITLVQNRAALERLLSLRIIKRIEVRLDRPNADVFADDFEARVEEQLLASHSKTLTIAYEAGPGDSIVATPEIRRIGEAGVQNGAVTVQGRDDTGAVTASSESYPEVVHDKYDPDNISEAEALKRLVGK